MVKWRALGGVLGYRGGWGHHEAAGVVTRGPGLS